MQFSSRLFFIIVGILLLVMFTQVFSLSWDNSGYKCLKNHYDTTAKSYLLWQVSKVQIYEHPHNLVCDQYYDSKTGAVVDPSEVQQ